MHTCVNGQVASPLALIGSAHASGAADWGLLDEHRKLVKAVEEANQGKAAMAGEGTKVEEKVSSSEGCHVRECTDPSHHHDHNHGHTHQHSAPLSTAGNCHDYACEDPTHDHSHAHSDHEAATCTDASHHHTRAEHGHDATSCTDPTHDHDHQHSHARVSDSTTAEQRFGITSFVYKRRRPFHPIRFSQFLQSMGKFSVTGVPEMKKIQSSIAAGSSSVATQKDEVVRAKRAVLRSKGFVWIGTSTQAAYFMSQAGQYLDLLVLGRWWAAIDQKDWPPAVHEEISVDFEGPHGDRRQEVVFIGQFGKDGGTSQRELGGVLDACLLSDQEMEEYERVSARGGDDALKSHFAPGFD